jgi:hypothetical protein
MLPHQWTRADALKALMSYYDRTGDLPSLAEAETIDTLPPPQVVSNLFCVGQYGATMRHLAESMSLESVYRYKAENDSWTATSITAAVLRYHALFGALPSWQEGQFRQDLPSGNTMAHTFLPWSNAMQVIAAANQIESVYADGVAPVGGPKDMWNASMVRDAIDVFVREHRRVPTMRDCRIENNLPSAETVVRHMNMPFAEAMELVAEEHNLSDSLRARPVFTAESGVAIPEGTGVVSREDAVWGERTMVAAGLSARRFMEAFRSAEGRFIPTAVRLKTDGFIVSDARVREIAKRVYDERREFYEAFWPAAPISMAGNTRPGDFEYKVGLIEKFANESGHCRVPKKYKPEGQNLYQFIKNQVLRIQRGTMPAEHMSRLHALPGGAEIFSA